MGKLPAPFLLFVFSTLFTLIIPSEGGLSFNFTGFSPGDPNITYKGDASPSSGAIQLTKNQRDADMNSSSGRATYHIPMQLWDKASGNLTDFTTHFSFSINSQNASTYADGLAFFLGPEQLPSVLSGGESLGLFRNNQSLNTTDNQFVAVEFDIYTNYEFDPPGEHVGTAFAIHTLRSWDFSSSLEIVGNVTNDGNVTNPLDPPAASPSNDGTRRNRKKNRTGLAVGLGVGGGAIVVGAAMVGFVFKFMCRHEEDEEGGHVLEEYMDDEFERGTGPKKFSYQELARATKNFKDEEKLGEGGFGGVYRGFLKEIDSFVAVKRVSRGSKQGIKEYAAEVKIISRLRHRNLVQLIGWCHERKELLLVYEFMPHGSLDSHLFKETSLLPWEASNEDQVSMVHWVWELYGEGKLIEAVDPRLCGDFNKTQVERLMIVGLSCAHPDEHLRPSIRQSLHVLNFDAPLPILPSKMPVPSYFAPPISASSLSIMSYGSADSTGGMNESSSYVYNTNSSHITTSSSASSASAMLLHTG
ncbi:hypothetical protein OIU84_025325 [Salix udensis]|uniref:Protein kinase domain-containing protein n=1 Tax=Salix udensis TaxID=889485 RepID=A0AAD6KLJ7_9ROSI|nr:hypothetical protein OIU84_025325 [Salix udensis]